MAETEFLPNMTANRCDMNKDANGCDLNLGKKLKEEIRLPRTPRRRVSLSDIIAATIGEEARSSDLLYSGENAFHAFSTEYGDIDTGRISDSTHVNTGHNGAQLSWNVSTENSNNACDLSNDAFQAKSNHIGSKKYFKDDSSSFEPKLSDFGERNDGHKVAPTFSFDTEMNFWTSLFGDENNTESETSDKTSLGKSQTTLSNKDKENSQKSANTSYDSDLEDSMQFVDPDDNNPKREPDNNPEPVEPVSKKPRVSLYDSSSCPFPITIDNFSESNQDFYDIFNDHSQPSQDLTSKAAFRMHGVTRARSFSGNIKPKLSRQSGKCNLRENPSKVSTFGRARSFSEACYRDELNQSVESSLNTSLSSLFESQEGSLQGNNPFFNDLKSLLISDCKATECPKTLFETLSSKPKQDVYARERNLQAKFSALQSKYSEEVRELSSFYRQQSAEVETERLKEIHDDSIPISYRNHLNSFYDNQLHMIMERVEKSISLLSIAKREIVTINRPFKSRPLLSRKAVKMMEEWYSRNFEHPYPGPTAVEALAKAGEITPEQVKKWFANKRNRCKNTKPVPEIANIKRKRQFSARW